MSFFRDKSQIVKIPISQAEECFKTFLDQDPDTHDFQSLKSLSFLSTDTYMYPVKPAVLHEVANRQSERQKISQTYQLKRNSIVEVY